LDTGWPLCQRGGDEYPERSVAYCRFGKDSDVYVFQAEDGSYICCGCDFDGGPVPNEGYGLAFSSPGQLLKHLLAHQAAGHQVPEKALERLAEEARLRP